MGLIVIALFALVLVGSITAAIAMHRKAAGRRDELEHERVALLAAAHKKAG